MGSRSNERRARRLSVRLDEGPGCYSLFRHDPDGWLAFCECGWTSLLPSQGEAAQAVRDHRASTLDRTDVLYALGVLGELARIAGIDVQATVEEVA